MCLYSLAIDRFPVSRSTRVPEAKRWPAREATVWIRRGKLRRKRIVQKTRFILSLTSRFLLDNGNAIDRTIMSTVHRLVSILVQGIGCVSVLLQPCPRPRVPRAQKKNPPILPESGMQSLLQKIALQTTQSRRLADSGSLFISFCCFSFSFFFLKPSF